MIGETAARNDMPPTGGPSTRVGITVEELGRRAYSYGDLNVMQAECGLIKVGRSIAPESRQSALIQYAQEHVALVAVLPGRGADEESVHIQLKRYRRHIEWFSGTEVGRKAVEQVLDLDGPRWPYAWNPETAQELLNHLFWKNRRRNLMKRRRYVINALKHNLPDSFMRSQILAATYSHGDIVVLMSRKTPQVTDLRTGITTDAPDYLSDHDIAATVGPPGWVGVNYVATPAQIVIAGLEALSVWERHQMETAWVWEP